MPPPQTELYVDLQKQLDPGEASSIALAISLLNTLLTVDERKGRRAATQLGVFVIGTPGVLLKAKEAGFIDSLRVVLQDIRRNTDFWFSLAIEKVLLEKAGE